MSWGKFSARDFSFSKSNTPSHLGPGTYYSDSKNKSYEHRCKTTFGISRDRKRNIFGVKIQSTPAPGEYDMTVTGFNTKTGTIMKSKTPRFLYNVSDTPSPADYNRQHDWSVKKTQRIKSSRKLHPPPLTINYGQGMGVEILPDGSMKVILKEVKNEEWIGPGSYNIPEVKNKIMHSLCGPRPESCLIDKRKNPGPGTYNPRKNTSHLCSNIQEIHKEKEPEITKGGELTHGDFVKKNGISSQFKSQTTREVWGKPKDYHVSPQKYGYESQKEEKRNFHAFNVGAERFVETKNDFPGPGQYEAKDCQWTTKKSSTVSSAVIKYDPSNDVPGPGTYESDSIWNIKKANPSPAFANTSSRLVNFGGNENPGPATYTINARSSSVKSKTIGSKSRKTSYFTPSDTPSPQEYDTRSMASGRRTTISRSGRRFDFPTTDTPGPGTYAVDHDHDNLIKRSFNSDLTGIRVNAINKH